MKIVFLAKLLNNNFRKFLYSNILVNQTGLSINVNKNDLEKFFFVFLKSSIFSFKSLIDIFAMDFLGRVDVYRFRVYYIFYSRLYGITLNIKVNLEIKDILISALVYYNSAGWLEREVYDMYGIFFYKNEDMRRILTDYGFDGYPLRKDFPLTGFFEVQYSEEEKIVVSQMTKVNQALRLFHSSTVWDLIKNK